VITPGLASARFPIRVRKYIYEENEEGGLYDAVEDKEE
jgi:hypothetical protein